jgi:alpha-aminoadipate/glutamate carrier protein LysW
MNAQLIMNCPNCNAPVEPEEDLEIGEAVECDQCAALLVVTSVDPLEFVLDDDDEDDDIDDDDPEDADKFDEDDEDDDIEEEDDEDEE